MAFKYKPSLVRLTLILSSFVLDVICFTPLPRFAQNSAHIGNRIYYMGGFVSLPEPIISDFFYLDISTFTSTDSGNLPWTELTGLDNLFTSWGTAVAGGANKDLFVLFGGQMTPSETSSIVIVYDTKSNTWSKPEISTVNETNLFFLNDMAILDTVNWAWSYGTQDGAPEARNDFSATILSNGYIVYIGGSNLNNRYVPMTQLNMYDTNSAAWINIEATGDTPNPRGGHSAVLTTDGRIIIYGGSFLISADGRYTAASPDLAVLETSNNNYVWSKPKASGISPPTIAYHAAYLVGDNMIISFGNITDKGPTSNLYALGTKDKNNYKWLTSLDIEASVPPGTISPVNNTSSNTGALVGAIIGSLIGLLLLGGGLFWFYRFNKNRKMMEGVIETPGESTDVGFSRRHETMNSTTTSQSSYDYSRNSTNTKVEEGDHSKEFPPSNLSIQYNLDIDDDDDDKEFRVLPEELQPEYLEKKYN
ncbi:12336_t:CDS:2 [Funneliformis caledonium]|uniref:12336_t:CDS:1 n=1 Tax=Funneliformis caledonium TaxID=1117310 RepID=A0A9N9FLA1_9GLOM|nr:12336_t:CDS:2 [Funneliformis caledonium]